MGILDIESMTLFFKIIIKKNITFFFFFYYYSCFIFCQFNLKKKKKVLFEFPKKGSTTQKNVTKKKKEKKKGESKNHIIDKWVLWNACTQLYGDYSIQWKNRLHRNTYIYVVGLFLIIYFPAERKKETALLTNIKLST